MFQDSMKGAPVPAGLPKQPTQPATSAVPKIIPFQKPNGMMAKLQMTSPEINRVLPEDEQSEHQAVTKPVALSNKVDEAESDELVWELESLHKENTHQNLSEKGERVNQVRVTTTPSAPLLPEKNQATSVNEVSKLFI